MAHEATKQYLDNLITRQQGHTNAINERTPKLLQKSKVPRLFSRFQAKYTHKWLSAIDNDEVYELAVIEWQEGLAGLSNKQILVGIANLPKSWPPTSGEFRDLCEEKNDEWSQNTAAYKFFDKSKAISYDGDRNLARKKLAEAKRILNGDRQIEVITA